MANIFNKLPHFEEKWTPIEVRAFDQEELDAVLEAVVRESKYGFSVKLVFKAGDFTFIPLEEGTSFSPGDKVDLTKVKLVTLAKPGRDNIYRIRD